MRILICVEDYETQEDNLIVVDGVTVSYDFEMEALTLSSMDIDCHLVSMPNYDEYVEICRGLLVNGYYDLSYKYAVDADRPTFDELKREGLRCTRFTK